MFLLINIYLILTIIRPQDYIPAFEAVRILPIVLAAAFLAWVISPNKNFSAPQFLLLGLFLGVAMVSEVASGWLGGALQVLAIFGPVVLTFAILANAVTTQRRVVVVMEILVLCAGVLALHGVLQVLYGIGWTGKPLVEDGRIQYVGIFSDPNDLGLLFVSVLPMAFYLSSRGGLLKLFWLGVAGLLLYGSYLTVSRGAVLAIAAIAVVYIWRRFGMLMASLCGVAGIAGILMLPSRLSEMSADESSAAGRVDAWYSGLQMFMENPLLGVGPGNFTEHNDLAAHNSLVLVLAETGIVGYVLWIAFVGYCFWMVYSAADHVGSDLDNESGWHQWRPIFATLLFSLVGWSVAAFFLSRSYVITLYLLTGLIVGAYATARTQVPSLRQFHLSNDLVRWPAIAVASIVALYVLVKVLL